MMIRFILLFLCFYSTRALYRCKNFHTNWDIYDNDGLFYKTSFDLKIIPTSPTSYFIQIYNLNSNSSGQIDISDYGTTDQYYINEQYHYCDGEEDFECLIPSSQNCSVQCSDIPYDGFALSVDFIDNMACGSMCAENIVQILVYNNMTYYGQNYRMFTPDHPEIEWVVSDGFLRQVCSEFEYIPDPVSEETCTEFVSQTSVRNAELNATYFNVTLRVIYDDVNGIVNVKLDQKIHLSDGKIHFDSPNNGGATGNSDSFLPDSQHTKYYVFNLTTEFFQLHNFVDFRLVFYDNVHSLKADIIPIEFYSINGLRMRTNLHPYTSSSPSDTGILGNVDSGLSVTSSYTCTKFTKYTPPTTTTAQPTKSPPKCPAGWYQGNVSPGKCYKFFKTEVAWTKALGHCKSFGGSLVSMDSAFENAEFFSVFSNDFPDDCSSSWLGYHYYTNISDWAWANGDTSAYSNWDNFRGYPQDSDTNRCAAILFEADLGNPNYWFNEGCSATECYGCQILV